LSGQIPLLPSTGLLVSEDVQAQTHQVMKNIENILKAWGLDFNKIVKSTIFLTDMSFFKTMNEVYSSYFQEPYPCRTTVAVKELPCGAKVEIEVVGCFEF
jgi:2-iminobutanoate/2-iminopropanoate deaminase